MVFSGVQQFQEEQVKEYKAQDKKFIKWAKEQESW